ncbi:beta-ketoacyl-ACP synthase II [Candidatus Spongiisocius sp.]|uniref:beta-ketoacyl-ACP synthase II n=1 Tax=Candidatus Spongiisocius sp. TaxID=3101273 RepID=UPI003B5C2230
MHGESRRVVVTGMGAITPLGHTVEDTWKAALAGESGIGPITQFDPSGVQTKFAGEVRGWDPELVIPRREARRLDRSAQLFVCAAQQAMDDSGLDFVADTSEADRAGVIVGSGLGGMLSFDNHLKVMLNRGASRISPLAVTMIIPNEAAGVASIRFNMRGPVTCVVTACAASANAIGDAAELIRRGAADVMLAGGAEATICEFGIGSFNSSKALSTRNEDPTGASRPFDANRDGFVMSEGGVCVILEDRERALARGARIHAEVIGYGMTSDAHHVTLPRPGGEGAGRAMAAALDSAGLQPQQLGYINAHGTSTKANDVTETQAIKLALGERAARAVPVSSTKSMTGHLMGGAGAVESIFCIQAINNGIIPPTINYTTPDPDCDLDYVPNEPREAEVEYAMTNSFGFGGHNVVLIFGPGG